MEKEKRVFFLTPLQQVSPISSARSRISIHSRYLTTLVGIPRHARCWLTSRTRSRADHRFGHARYEAQRAGKIRRARITIVVRRSWSDSQGISNSSARLQDTKIDRGGKAAAHFTIARSTLVFVAACCLSFELAHVSLARKQLRNGRSRNRIRRSRYILDGRASWTRGSIQSMNPAA